MIRSDANLFLKEIQSIVRHEACIDTFCTTNNTCDWIRYSIAHPEWRNEELDKNWSAGNQFGGELLEISD